MCPLINSKKNYFTLGTKMEILTYVYTPYQSTVQDTGYVSIDHGLYMLLPSGGWTLAKAFLGMPNL